MSKIHRQLVNQTYILCSLLSVLPYTFAADSASLSYAYERMWPASPQPWSFENIYSIASAPDGSLWVTDEGVYNLSTPIKLQHLNPDGSIIGQFQSNNDLFGGVQRSSVAVASDASVWTIGDRGQVQHYSSAGKLLTLFNVPFSNSVSVTDTTTPQFNYHTIHFAIAAATEGGAWVANNEGYLRRYSPEGNIVFETSNLPTDDLAIAKDGSLWLLDTSHHQIRHIDSQGRLIASLGGQGSLPLQFSFPLGIAIAPDDSVWVADSGNFRLQHFTPDGSFISQIGIQGSAPGQFNAAALEGIRVSNDNVKSLGPTDLSIAADGSVWVADGGNGRVQHFSADGRYLAQFGRANENAAVENNLGQAMQLAIDTDDSIWLSTINGNYEHIRADGSFIAQSTNSSVVPQRTAKPAADGSIWRINPQDNSIAQHLDKNGAVIASVKSQNKPPENSPPDNILNLYHATTAWDGSLWVTDSDLYGSLQHFDAQGNFLFQFRNNVDFAMEPDGSVWVLDIAADVWNYHVQHFNLRGELLEQFGVSGRDPGQFTYPTALVRASNGALWITDNKRVQKFTRQAPQAPSAEYSEQQKRLILHDVTIGKGQTHYTAVLQQQNEQVILLDAQITDQRRYASANLDPATNSLYVPLIQVKAKQQHAFFKYLENNKLQLLNFGDL